MAQEGPKRAPRGLQEVPQEGSKRELGTNLSQRPLWDPPRTLPDPSGERFWGQFGPKRRSLGGQNRWKNMVLEEGENEASDKEGVQRPV